MKRKFLSLITAFTMLASLIVMPAGAAGGTGAENDPIIISTADELASLAAEVNGGDSKDGVFYKLGNNIDIPATVDWTPIGEYVDENTYKPFAGTFDGNGYEISGLYIDNSADGQGLFGVNSGTIKNLTVSGEVTAKTSIGGVCGVNYMGTIENCSNRVVVTGNSGHYVGGICGDNHGGTVKNCYNRGEISGVYSVGGICGYNYHKLIDTESVSALITNCYNVGDIISTSYAGGICGINFVTESYESDDSQITNCYNVACFKVNRNYVGGICGQNNGGKLTSCYYLTGCAKDGNGTAQNGIGTEIEGSAAADVSGQTDAKEENGFTDTTAFTDWDFDNTWQINTFLSRPILKTIPELKSDLAGKGTEDEPYLIPDAQTLASVRDIVNTGYSFGGMYFELQNDIDLSGECGESVGNWKPIGMYDETKNIPLPFAGIFDGAGHKITNLYINNIHSACTGLFGVNMGIIKNLTVSGNVTADTCVGGVCGRNFAGIIENCQSSVSLTGIFCVGGICGINEEGGIITDCVNNGALTAPEESAAAQAFGGICGMNSSSVKNCRNTGAIYVGEGIEGEGIGGICGIHQPTEETDKILNCNNSGDINASNGGNVGGVCGRNNGTAEKCFNTGAVSGMLYVGGISGSDSINTIVNCYNTGAISGTSYIGGLSGLSAGGEIQNSYNSGSVSGTAAYVGALCGASESSITNCYYLENCALSGTAMQNGIGSEDPAIPTADTDGINAKTAAQFADGSLSWALQNAQPSEETTRVWGQKLNRETGADASPILSAEDKVYKITYKITDTQNEGQYTDYAVNYANSGYVRLSDAPPADDGYIFEKWSLTPSASGAALNSTSELTEDISVYAINSLKTAYGTAAELNLSEYMPYDGTPKEGKFIYTITDGNAALGASVSEINTDMLIIPADAPAGTYTLTINASEKVSPAPLSMLNTGGFEFRVNVTVDPKAVTEIAASDIEAQTYIGSAITPSVTVKDGDKTLTADSDYTAVYSDNINVGTAKVTLTGKGNYSGTLNKEFTVQPKTITQDMIDDIAEQGYTGSQITPAVSVKYNGITLTDADYTVEYGTNITGNGSVTVTGKGNYSGSAVKNFTIGAKAITADMIADIDAQTYTGSAITPSVTVKDGDKTLVPDTDYTAVYSDNINAGTAKVAITGKGNYSGTLDKEFTVQPKTITQDMIDDIAEQGYTGSQLTPAISVKYNGITLTDADYTVEYGANIAGNGSVTVTGKGNYSGSAVKNFTIGAKAITADMIADIDAQTYTGSAITPSVTVKDGDKTLTADTDYTAVYSDNINSGTAKVAITGKGNYTGSAVKNFTIGTKAITADMIADIDAQTYTGSAVTPSVTVKDGDKTLVPDTDYTITYSDNINAGTAKVAITGKGNYSGSAVIEFIINPKDISDCTADEISNQSFNNGNEIKPPVSVKDGDKSLANGTDFDVKYENNTEIGAASVIITGKGNYTGTLKTSFEIAPIPAMETPGITADDINYINETLTGFIDGTSYKINGAAAEITGGAIDITPYIGTTLSVVLCGDGVNYLDSAAKEINIPARPAAPELSVSGSAINGAAETMEFRLLGDETWIDCGSTDMSAMEDGTYEIRLKAAQTSFSGEISSVRVVSVMCVKITAEYDGNGVMTNVNIENSKVPAEAPQNTASKKTFYWVSLESMQPIEF